jgi:hypothetical protein
MSRREMKRKAAGFAGRISSDILAKIDVSGSTRGMPKYDRIVRKALIKEIAIRGLVTEGV